MKILVVDDDAMVIQSCRRILEEGGLLVQTAPDVDSGIAYLAKEPFDLVLTDIKMPGRDGFEMIEHVKTTQPSLPVLMMTGYLTPETIDRGMQLGADQFIAKPFTPQELMTAVENQLQNRSCCYLEAFSTAIHSRNNHIEGVL